MTDKKKTKILIIALLLFLFALGCVVFYRVALIVHEAGRLAATAGLVDQAICFYIRENNGQFPANEADLQQQYLFRKTKSGENYDYFIRLAPFGHEDPEVEKGWIKLGLFSLLKISYGVKIENVKMIDGKLYDKFTNEQILLLDGDYRKNLKELYYEPISVKWYELMLEEKQRAKQ